MTDEPLTGGQVAALLGIQPATWRSYVSRRQAPAPDGWHDKRTPWWHRSTIEAWRGRPLADRATRARTGLPGRPNRVATNRRPARPRRNGPVS